MVAFCQYLELMPPPHCRLFGDASMRFPVLKRLLGLGSRERDQHSEPLHDQEPHLRIDSYSRLSDMEDSRLASRPGSMTKPLKAGDAAALGHRLLAGREEWVRVDANGHADLVEVHTHTQAQNNADIFTQFCWFSWFILCQKYIQKYRTGQMRSSVICCHSFPDMLQRAQLLPNG